MARTKLTLLFSPVALVSLLVLAPGCFMMEANITVNVDGSSDVELKVGAAAAIMDMQDEGEDPFAQIAEDLPEGWTVNPLESEEWRGVVISGRAPAGEALLPSPEKAPSDIKLSVVRRLFSTDYVVDGVFSVQGAPDQAPDAEAAAPGEPRIVFTQLPDLGVQEQEEGEGEFDAEAFAELLGAMAVQPRISFSIKAPGTVVETTGAVNERGAAVWSFNVPGLMTEGPPPEFRVLLRTRLLNYANIGRLADRLAAEADMPDMAPMIADCVTRGLLPNPPRDDPARATFDVEAYVAALRIVTTLDRLLGPPTTARVIAGLKLNADDVTAKQLRQTWEMLDKTEPEELIEVVAQAVLKHMRMRR